MSVGSEGAVVAQAIEQALGERPRSLTPLGGGDVAASYRVGLDSGFVFAKTKRAAPDGFFTTEALGLRWLREADAVAVPEVVAYGDDPPFLVLEWIEPGAAVPGSEERFGVELARLHEAGAAAHGRLDRRSTGSRGLPNEPCATWAEFYATQRLLPLAELAEQSGALPADAVHRLRLVADRIDAWAPPEEPASRLHGDLWGGNRLMGRNGASWLIDPAAIGGHREFDLSMMRLFGGFGPAVYEAYARAATLDPEWEHRIPLHQLAPLVVHAIKFGGWYGGAVISALDSLR